MTPADLALFRSLSDLQIMATTICGEAEGEKLAGKFGVGFVILNRSVLGHKSIPEVCLQRNQFECFNEGNKRLPILRNMASNWNASLDRLKDSVIAAKGVLSGSLLSNVGKSTFYKVITCESPWFDKALRNGTIRKCCEVGAHEFFEETKYMEA
jgi:N-acetylmuramoyl-L-alanine amidase